MTKPTTHFPTLYREMVLDRADVFDAITGDLVDPTAADAAHATDDRVPMSMSSEFAVERGGLFDEPFLEVLDHGAGAVDLSRTQGGLPLLLDHDPTRQIGVIEDVTVGADRVLRGRARFSRSALAQEVRQDVLDGIRTRTSIGYRIRELTQTARAEGQTPATYRATKWQLLENSLVSVPADPTVGVGRGAGEAAYPVTVRTLAPSDAPQGQENRMSAQDTAAPTGAAPQDTRVDVTRHETSGMSAVELREMINVAALHGLDVGKHVNGDVTAAQARASMNAELRERMERGPVTKPRVTLTEKEEKAYSFSRAILAQTENGECFERDVHEEIARKLPAGYKPQGGFFIPTNVRAGLDSATSTKGAETKFVHSGSFIDLLRANARVLQAGATMLPGLDGPVTFPKQNGAGSISWMGENSGTDVVESNLTLTTVSLTAKTVQSTTSFSRQLLRQAVIDVEALVRADLAAIHALGIDAAALFGTGASNQPTGVYNQSGVGVVAIGTNGGAPTYAHAVNLGVLVEQANADSLGSPALITTPGIKGTYKMTQKFATTNGAPVWGDDNVVAGMQAYSTNQVQSNLSKGTGSNLHALYAGIWSQLLIGEFGAMEVLTDPYRLKKQGMIEVTSFQMIDIAVRYAGAFAIIKDAISQF